MDAEILKLHRKIAAISYRLDDLSAGVVVPPYPCPYAVGQLILWPNNPEQLVVIAGCTFCPTDGQVYGSGSNTFQCEDLRGRLVGCYGRGFMEPGPVGPAPEEGCTVVDHLHWTDGYDQPGDPMDLVWLNNSL